MEHFFGGCAKPASQPPIRCDNIDPVGNLGPLWIHSAAVCFNTPVTWIGLLLYKTWMDQLYCFQAPSV
ncbi:hypothetical protein VTP01DRAFT_9259 [Rhizomucor pusillus]|uniref:uncharacterized protein n=1 Tax=Rhizomucor pusillus TaxID=4840 RepID=UPI0037441399